MENFVDAVKERFTIRKTIIDGEVSFNGARIRQETSSTVTMSMNEYLTSIKPIEISEDRRGNRSLPATAKEASKFRALSGELL